MFNEAFCCGTQTNDNESIAPSFEVRFQQSHSQDGNESLANGLCLALESPCSNLRERRLQDGGIVCNYGGQPAPTTIPPVRAIQAIAQMPGGSQSKLMLGEDRNLWVVKFKNNPQHLKILVNELMASRMAEAIGLSVPQSGIIHVTQELVENNQQLLVDHGRGWREMCSSGLQFGSRFVGGLMPRQVIDFLPCEELYTVRNLEEFAGMLAFDKWTSNTDRRQAVFRRTARETQYGAVFVDHGFCFSGSKWTFQNAIVQGLYAHKSAYSTVTSWSSFEPWLTRIEQFNPDALWKIAQAIPPEWYRGDTYDLEELVETLLVRRSSVRELIRHLQQSSYTPFPNWKNDRYAILHECILPYEGMYICKNGIATAAEV